MPNEALGAILGANLESISLIGATGRLHPAKLPPLAGYCGHVSHIDVDVVMWYEETWPRRTWWRRHISTGGEVVGVDKLKTL